MGWAQNNITEHKLAQQQRNGKIFRWGIWGTGTIASSFAADIALSDDMEIASICSRTAESANQFQLRYGAQKIYTDPADFLRNPDIDAVYIATPNATHVSQTLAAIAAGKPCLTEKPLSIDAKGAAQIEQASKEHQVFTMEAMWSRFLPAIKAAKDHIDAGRIGHVTHIEADLSYFRAEDAKNRFFDPQLGGGAAFDLGVYPVSLTLYFLGLPDSIQGSWKASKTGVDLRTHIELTYPYAKARLSCGFDHDGKNQMLIKGTDGAILIHAPFLKAQRLTIFSRKALQSPFTPDQTNGILGKIINRLPLPGRTTEHYAFKGNGLHFQAQAVRDAVHNGKISQPSMPLSHSVAVAEIIETVLRLPSDRQ